LESESVCPYAWSLEFGFFGFEVSHGGPAPILQVEFMSLHWTTYKKLLFGVAWSTITKEREPILFKEEV
jgi:hypothetical protein